MESHIEKYNNENEMILKYDKNYKSNHCDVCKKNCHLFYFSKFSCKVMNVRHKSIKLAFIIMIIMKKLLINS